MTPLAVWLLIVNLTGFVLMGEDKRRAIVNARRIPERTLLLTAVLGGAAGALAGMVSYNHKTRHPQFYIGLPCILFAQILLWILLRFVL